MSKKLRQKKQYRPRAVSVPPMLSTLKLPKLTADAREEDRVFLLRMANGTAENDEVVLYSRFMQVAWILAVKMENPVQIREAFREGLRAMGAYLAEGHLEFTPRVVKLRLSGRGYKALVVTHLHSGVSC